MNLKETSYEFPNNSSRLNGFTTPSLLLAKGIESMPHEGKESAGTVEKVSV